MAFNTDESHLFEFWKENFHSGDGEPTSHEFASAINPGNYSPMPGSSTRKDVTYDTKYNSHYILFSELMGKHRQMHYHQMVHVNPNTVQDFRNTFCVALNTVKMHELSHRPQNDVTKNKFADGVFANEEEYLRLMKVEDNLGAANLFHVQVGTGNVQDETVAVTQSLVNMGLNHLKGMLELACADAIKVLISKAKEIVAPLTKKFLEALILQVQTKIKPKFVDSFLKFVTKAKEGGSYMCEEAVNELNQYLLDGNFSQIKDNIVDRMKTLLKDTAIRVKDGDLKLPEIPKGAKKSGDFAGIDGSSPGNVEMAERVHDAQIKPDMPLYEDSIDEAGEAIDEAAMVEKAAVPEFEVATETAAEAVTPFLETVAEGMSALGPEMLPVAAMTGVLMGIDALLAKSREKEEAERKKEAAAKQAEIDKAAVRKYYNELVYVTLGQQHSTTMRTFLTAKVLGDDYTNFSLPYCVLLTKILNNELCVDVVDPQWLHNNKDNMKGKNILTAEMIQSMCVVDYYLHESTDMMPDDNAASNWTGTFRPYPPTANDPATFQSETMTPLPVITKKIRAKLNTDALKLYGDSVFYGPWIPSVITVEEPESTLSLDAGSDVKKDVKMDKFKWHIIPVPVFVGFMASPTGFVSSENPDIAWPTVANKNGGYIKIDALTVHPNTFAVTFKDRMEYYAWRYAKPDNTNAKLLSTPRTGLGLSLSADGPSKDGANNPNDIIFYFNNKTNREIIPILFSTSSPGADLKKATKTAIAPRYLGCYKDYNYDLEMGLATQLPDVMHYVGHAVGGDERPLYAMGPAGTAKCPAGYEQITTEAEAKRAAMYLGYKFASAGQYQQATIGALYNGAAVYFNTKAGGSTNSHHKSVCKLSAVTKTFHTVADALAMAQGSITASNNDDTYIGLQNMQSDGRCEVYIGKDPNGNKYSTYGHAPPGSCMMTSDGFHVGGAFVNAVYKLDMMAVQDLKAKLLHHLSPNDYTLHSVSQADKDMGQSNQIMFVLAQEVKNISLDVLDYQHFKPVASIGKIQTLLNTNGPTRSPILRIDQTYGPDKQVTTLGIEKMAEVFVCPNTAKLYEKIARGRTLTKQHMQVYTVLHKFFDAVEADMIVQSDLGCDFAKWLINQFGQVIVAQEMYYSKPTMLYELYTHIQQCALYFTFIHIWSTKHDAFDGGPSLWDTIFGDMMALDGASKYLVTDTQRDMWKQMGEIPREQDKLPIPDITPHPANEQNMGYMLQPGDMDMSSKDMLNYNKVLWTKISYGFSVESSKFNAFDLYMVALPALGDFETSTGDYDQVAYKKKTMEVWTRTLPILNNKQAGNPASEDHSEHLVEQVHLARITIAECLYTNFKNDIVLKDMTACYKDPKFNIKTNFLHTVQHMIKM